MGLSTKGPCNFFGGVFEFNLVSLIRVIDFTVPVSIIFLSDSSGNPVERSCVPWNPLVGGYFFVLLDGDKEPFLLTWAYLESGNLGNRLQIFLRIHLLGLLQICFLAIVKSRQKSPPVSFLFIGTGLGAQCSRGSTFDEFRNQLKLNCGRWQIIRMIFLDQ